MRKYRRFGCDLKAQWDGLWSACRLLRLLRGAGAACLQARCVREKSTGIPLWRANGKEKEQRGSKAEVVRKRRKDRKKEP